MNDTLLSGAISEVYFPFGKVVTTSLLSNKILEASLRIPNDQSVRSDIEKFIIAYVIYSCARKT